ncbi:hypothetical protein pb186bvf_020533 [Paramecium bursaria]
MFQSQIIQEQIEYCYSASIFICEKTEKITIQGSFEQELLTSLSNKINTRGINWVIYKFILRQFIDLTSLTSKFHLCCKCQDDMINPYQRHSIYDDFFYQYLNTYFCDRIQTVRETFRIDNYYSSFGCRLYRDQSVKN